MNKIALEIIVFICGAAIMILEMTGSRVLAPYLGTSVFVWTSLIGIILGCLSWGYWWGGKIADRRPEPQVFSYIIFLSAVWTGLVAFANEPVLSFLQAQIQDIRLGAGLASLILFGVPGILLGMVSPYAVRLKLKRLDTSGSEVGRLYAISTIGSIAGTFLAGFVLIAYFSNSIILFILAGVLGLCALLANRVLQLVKVIFIIGSGLGAATAGYASQAFYGSEFIDVNTAYNRVWIVKATAPVTGRPIKIMKANGSQSSAAYLDGDDLVFPYTRFYRLARHFKPNLHQALLLGGAGYSYPKDFLKNFPSATMDVVEIDPQLTDLAKQHFGLKEDPRLHIYHQDGRIFLNRSSSKRYDVYFGDAFNTTYSIPFHLTTVEAVKAIYDTLADDGVVLMNIISAIEGEQGQFLRAEYHSFRSVFPQVYLFPVWWPDRGEIVQNVILVALKSSTPPSFTSADPELDQYLKHLWRAEIQRDVPVLTDNFAPVEWYTYKMVPYFYGNSHPYWGRIFAKEKNNTSQPDLPKPNEA